MPSLSPAAVPGKCLVSSGSRKEKNFQKTLAKLAPLVSAVILVFLYRDVSPGSLLSALSKISVAWAVVFVFLSSMEPILRGLRWSTLLGGAPASSSVKSLYIAKAVNNLLPLRAGDAIRAQFAHDRMRIPYSGSAASLIAELAIDLFVLCVLGLGFALFTTHLHPLLLPISAAGAISIAAVALLLPWWTARNRTRERGVIRGFLHRTVGKISGLVSGKRRLQAVFWSILIWAHALAASYCGLRMCLPVVTLQGTLASILFVYLSVAVPSAPGFIGTYHAAVVGSMAIMGYSIIDYPAVPVVIHALQMIPQTLIGLASGFRYIAGNDWRSAFLKLRDARRETREVSE